MKLAMDEPKLVEVSKLQHRFKDYLMPTTAKQKLKKQTIEQVLGEVNQSFICENCPGTFVSAWNHGHQ